MKCEENDKANINDDDSRDVTTSGNCVVYCKKNSRACVFTCQPLTVPQKEVSAVKHGLLLLVLQLSDVKSCGFVFVYLSYTNLWVC